MIKAALFCYALTGFREARGEGLAAQFAVMKVLENRARLNQKPPCVELAKHRQFAFVRKYGVTHPKPIGELDINAWFQSRRIAHALKHVMVKGITPHHTYFNHIKLGKRYKTKTQPVQIGQLLFY